MVWSETEDRRAYAAQKCADTCSTVLSVLYYFHFGKKYKTEVADLIILGGFAKLQKATIPLVMSVYPSICPSLRME